eukprot:13074786-Alexandrium_andersonii.AAC.1
MGVCGEAARRVGHVPYEAELEFLDMSRMRRTWTECFECALVVAAETLGESAKRGAVFRERGSEGEWEHTGERERDGESGEVVDIVGR